MATRQLWHYLWCIGINFLVTFGQAGQMFPWSRSSHRKERLRSSWLMYLRKNQKLHFYVCLYMKFLTCTLQTHPTAMSICPSSVSITNSWQFLSTLMKLHLLWKQDEDIWSRVLCKGLSELLGTLTTKLLPSWGGQMKKPAEGVEERLARDELVPWWLVLVRTDSIPVRYYVLLLSIKRFKQPYFTNIFYYHDECSNN